MGGGGVVEGRAARGGRGALEGVWRGAAPAQATPLTCEKSQRGIDVLERGDVGEDLRVCAGGTSSRRGRGRRPRRRLAAVPPRTLMAVPPHMARLSNPISLSRFTTPTIQGSSMRAGPRGGGRVAIGGAAVGNRRARCPRGAYLAVCERCGKGGRPSCRRVCRHRIRQGGGMCPRAPARNHSSCYCCCCQSRTCTLKGGGGLLATRRPPPRPPPRSRGRGSADGGSAAAQPRSPTP